jgi:hypothetical protein
MTWIEKRRLPAPLLGRMGDKMEMEIREVDIEKLEPAPYNPRA